MVLWETVILCGIFWLMCWLGTGTDEKNIKSLASYPDAVQQMVRQDAALKGMIREKSGAASFAGNFVTFGVLLFLLGLPAREEGFSLNFANILFIGEVLNLFDFLVIDMMWWRYSPRIRFSATKDQPELYQDMKYHRDSFMKGFVLFILVALLDGFLLSLF